MAHKLKRVLMLYVPQKTGGGCRGGPWIATVQSKAKHLSISRQAYVTLRRTADTLILTSTPYQTDPNLLVAAKTAADAELPYGASR